MIESLEMPEPLCPTWSLERLRSSLTDFNALPFVAVFGARAEIVDEHRIGVVIDPILDIHRGGIQTGVVNGGVIAAVFDLALGLPVRIRSRSEGKRSATVQLAINMMRALKGDRLVAEGWIARGGSGLFFTEAEIRDEKGARCASATGVVRVLDGYSEPSTF